MTDVSPPPPDGPEQHAEAADHAQQFNVQYGQINVFTSGASAAPPATAPEDDVLPAALLQLVESMRHVTDELPYTLRGARRVSLSNIYVQQRVTTPAADIRRAWEEELEEAGLIESYRRVSPLAQPFEDVFQQHDHLVIEGAAGLGKTTLGYHLAGEQAKALLNVADRELHIPLVVPARVLAAKLRDLPWKGALRAAVEEFHRDVSDDDIPVDVFTRRVGGLRWLIVVDALDEIPADDDRERLLKALAKRMTTPSGAARFVITTRPLEPGETARLQGSRVGFYELQPFDEEALAKFAHNWFNPDRKAEDELIAAEFLDQVRSAPLKEIITVPLLATVAARVFESRPDRPLPTSRFELYEDYIDLMAQARADALEELRQASGGRELITWLDQHRLTLLERLATAYLSRETPLLDVMEQALNEAAAAAIRLPVDRSELVIGWLSQTGVLGRYRGRLSFLHQTFAEHLAASAEAKTLPGTFAQDRAPWTDLVRRLLFDDEQAERVVLHYLHHRGPATGLLDRLQRGTEDQRDCAAELIAKGARPDDTQLAAHLTFVETEVLAGTFGGLKSLAPLTRDATVQDRLEKLFAHPAVKPAAKIAIIDLLGDRNAQRRFQRAAFLTAYTDASRSPDLRRQAAAALAKFRGQHREHAVGVLAELAEDPLLATTGRLRSAELLAKLGGRHRDNAAQALGRLAAETTDPYERLRVATALAGLGGEFRDQAAAAYRGMVADPTVRPNISREAAAELAKLGGAYRQEALRILGVMAADPMAEPTERALTLSAAARIDPRHLDDAARRLFETAADPLLRAHERMKAAQALAELGAEHRARSADIFASFMTDATAEAYDRLNAAGQLLQLGPEGRSRAAEALYWAAILPTESKSAWLRAAEELAKLGGDQQIQAAHLLGELSRGAALDPMMRLESARALAKLGPTYEREANDTFGSLLNDPQAAPTDLVLAAMVLGSLEPDRRTVLGALMYRVATSATTDAQIRQLVGATLINWGHGLASPGADLLIEIFEDPLADTGLRDASASLGANLGEEQRVGVVRLLDEFADSAVDGRDRDMAAWLLWELNHDDPAETRRSLTRFINDPSVAAHSRMDFAAELGELGSDGRVEAVKALKTIISDLATPAYERSRAANVLSGWSEHRAEAARLLRSLAAERSCAADVRRGAAESLAGLGEEHRLTADRIVGEIAIEPELSPVERALTLAAQANIDPATRDRAVAALQDAMMHPDISHQQLWHMARRLVRLGARPGVHLARVLGELATAADLSAEDRVAAAQSLARLGYDQQDRAAAALRLIISEAANDGDVRCQAAKQLAKHGPDALNEAIRALAELAEGDHVPADTRRHAAGLLVDLNTHACDRARHALQRLACDRSADPWNRLRASEDLSRLGPDARRIAARALSELRDESPSSLLRACTTAALATIHERYYADALEELTALATGGGDAVAWERHYAALSLPRLSRYVRDRGADLLAALAADGRVSTWERRQAADALGRFGPRRRRQAAGLLAEIPTAEADAWERAEAAQAMGELNPERHDAAQEQLMNIATDPNVSVPERRYAAQGLRGTTKAEMLATIARDRTADPEERRAAAVEMARLGADDGKGREILAEMAADPGVSAFEQAQSCFELSSFDHRFRIKAEEAFQRVAADSAVAAAERRAAAVALASLGRRHRPIVGELLTRLVEETEDAPLEQALTRAALAEIQPAHRDAAEAAISRCLDGFEGTPDERRRLAVALGTLHRWHRADAVLQLRLIVIDRGHDSADRLRAAESIASLLSVNGRVNGIRPELD